MTDLLLPLLNKDNEQMFDSICQKFFNDYGGKKGFLTRNEMRRPIGEITKELYGMKVDNETFNLIYNDLDKSGKGKLSYQDFKGIVKCLILSLINYAERINGTSSVDISLEPLGNNEAEFVVYPRGEGGIGAGEFALMMEPETTIDMTGGVLEISDDIDFGVEELAILDDHMLNQQFRHSQQKYLNNKKRNKNKKNKKNDAHFHSFPKRKHRRRKKKPGNGNTEN